MTYLNPELIQKSEHVEQLREIEEAMFLAPHQRWQSLTIQNEVEKMRLPIAFVDMVFRRDKVKKTLYLTAVPNAVENVQRSFELHSQLSVIQLGEYLDNIANDMDISNMNEQQLTEDEITKAQLDKKCSHEPTTDVMVDSLIGFSEKLMYAKQAEIFLQHFNLVVIESVELPVYELIKTRLTRLYRGCVFEVIYKPQRLNL